MRVRKIGNTIVGADLTSAERKAMEIEVKKEVAKTLAEMDAKNTKEIDAMVLWVLHEQFGFGPERLKRFHDNFIPVMDALVKHYNMGKTDSAWLSTHMLERYGIDLDKWYEEYTEKNGDTK